MKSKLIPSLLGRSLLAGALLIGLAGTATAGTASATFNAGVTINSACSVTGTPVDFGSIGILADADNNVTGADNLQTTSTLTLNCTASTPITISVSGAGGIGGQFGTFTMTDGSGDSLNYRITQDAAGQIPWYTVSGNQALAMTSTVGSATVPMYFSILGADNAGSPGTPKPVKAGSYSDTATVTVAF